MSGAEPSDAAGRWARVKALLQGALARPPATRAAFVATSGAGPATRAELEALLAAHDGSAPYLDGSAGALVGLVDGEADERESEAEPAELGTLVGPYRLLRLIGRGGMGAVYLAEREDGFHRQVALKRIARAFPGESLLRRFEREREILARLDHPHIATLYDGGTAADGRPYLVMKLVSGEPIDRHCARHGLGVEERLRLFLAVCDAVQYAHRNLVVHRDLKPANILVGADGAPMLLDFGVATLLEPGTSGAGGADLTAWGRPLTPDYASPEQLRGEPITTASDVYQLGVVLFQLLAGTLPHRYTGDPLDLLRQRLAQPPRPSTATRPGGATTAEQALTLRRRLRGDLDTIVQRALQPEPARRYASVEALAEDVRRHLAGLPVRARPDTLAYRARKFVGRHRLAVAAATLVAAALVASTTVAMVQARRAERRFAEVRGLAHSFLFEFHDAIADLPGSTPARELLVKRALEYLDRLAHEAGGDEALLGELAQAYEKVGDVQGMPRAASLGHSADALRSYGKALAIARRLAAAEPRDARRRLAIADLEDRIGDVEAVQGQLASSLARRRAALGVVQAVWREQGYAPARRQWIMERVALSDALYEAGRRTEAVTGYRDALAEAQRRLYDEPANKEARRHVGVIEQRLGDAARESGDWRDEIVHDRASLAVDEALLHDDPRSLETRRDLATDHTRLALARRNAGDLAGALAEHRQALALRRALAAADAADARARVDTAESLSQIAQVQGEMGAHAEALATWQECLALRRAQAAADAGNAHLQDELASDLEGAGGERIAAGEAPAGFAALREAVALRARITAAAPDFFDNRLHGARLAAALGRALTPGDGAAGAEACDWLRRGAQQFAALRTSPGLAGADEAAAAAALRDAGRCTGSR